MVTLPAFKIRKVLLIGISLPLIRYCTISLMTVSEDDKPDKPFNNIPQVEKHIEHFLHLLGMYLFVIESLITDWLVSSCEENPEEVHVTETSRGNESVLYYLHTMSPYLTIQSLRRSVLRIRMMHLPNFYFLKTCRYI